MLKHPRGEKPQPLYTEYDEGRVVTAPSSPEDLYRTPYRRDYSRLLHSAAFRRLQGKTQLFPGHESDFFRNRLTHSLEVAQIAKTLALKINATQPYFKANNIDLDLVETAALAHDLGHPPFGHNGELALDTCMADSGGYEGNAQTLRNLAKLSKRDTPSRNGTPIQNHCDVRAGLNLTYRTLASTLKYDNEIPHLQKQRKNQGDICKGFYYTESSLVTRIKENVGYNRIPRTAGSNPPPFKTIECYIMDVADDIAYATYDIEDALKAGFITPVKIVTSLMHNERLLDAIIENVKKKLKREFPQSAEKEITPAGVWRTILNVLSDVFEEGGNYVDLLFSSSEDGEIPKSAILTLAMSAMVRRSELTAEDAYFRTTFTSQLVKRYLESVEVEVYDPLPAVSRAFLPIEIFKEIEILKSFTFEYLTMSPMLRVTEFRGKEIVSALFKSMDTSNGHMLLPDDFRTFYNGLKDGLEKKRVICDFIAGMTDRYAAQFYERLFGHSPESIWAPL